MRGVRRAYRLSPPENRLRDLLRVGCYTVLLLFSIALTLLLATLGRGAVSAFADCFALPGSFAEIWAAARFLLLGLIVFAAMGVLYAAAQGRRRGQRTILPGAGLSTLSWIILSALYSFYVEYISNYDLIYGALGTVIVLLIWLYLTALTLILGAEVNDTLACLRQKDPRRNRP